MRNVLLLLVPLAFFLSCGQSEKKEASHHDEMIMTAAKDSCCVVRDGLFLHISSGYDNPHKVLMALKMALMMSEDKDVVLYLDIEAVKLVLKDSKDMKFADFPTLKELLKSLVDKKITIMACPTCLKIAGKTGDDLIPGVIVAQKDKFFNFTKGRIVALDY